MNNYNLYHFCLGNDNFTGYSNGCFKRLDINIDEIKYKKRWNSQSRKYEDSYFFICNYCNKITIIDERIIPEEIKQLIKNNMCLVLK